MELSLIGAAGQIGTPLSLLCKSVIPPPPYPIITNVH